MEIDHKPGHLFEPEEVNMKNGLHEIQADQGTTNKAHPFEMLHKDLEREQQRSENLKDQVQVLSDELALTQAKLEKQEQELKQQLDQAQDKIRGLMKELALVQEQNKKAYFNEQDLSRKQEAEKLTKQLALLNERYANEAALYSQQLSVAHEQLQHALEANHELEIQLQRDKHELKQRRQTGNKAATSLQSVSASTSDKKISTTQCLRTGGSGPITVVLHIRNGSAGTLALLAIVAPLLLILFLRLALLGSSTNGFAPPT